MRDAKTWRMCARLIPNDLKNESPFLLYRIPWFYHALFQRVEISYFHSDFSIENAASGFDIVFKANQANGLHIKITSQGYH